MYLSGIHCIYCPQEGHLLPRDPLDTYSEWTCSQCDFYLEVSYKYHHVVLKHLYSLYQFVWFISYSFYAHTYED